MVPDNDLIRKVKNEQCNESLKTLIKRHTALCLSVFQKYSAFFASDPERFQDLVKDKDFLIYKSALSYEDDKGAKFVTWLGNQARYECLNALNSKNRALIPVEDKELYYFLDQKQNEEESVDQNEVDYVFTILGKLKDKRIKDVFVLRYSGPKNISWSRIAAKLQISTQTAINLHEKGVEILSQKLKSEECFDEI